MIFQFPKGLSSYIAELINKDYEVLHPVIYVEGKEIEILVELEEDYAYKRSLYGEVDNEAKVKTNVLVEIALQYNNSDYETVLSFANYNETLFGGSHVNSFFDTLVDCIVNYSNRQSIAIPEEPNILDEQVRKGLTAIISVKLPYPVTINSVRWKLGNPEAGYAVRSIFSKALEIWLDEHPEEAKMILKKILRDSGNLKRQG